MENDFWKQIKTSDAVKLFREMLSLRNDFAEPDASVSMTDVWLELADDRYQKTDEYRTKIKLYSGSDTDDTKAGVVVFGNLLTLVVTKHFWELARKNSVLQNFLLAHEFAHVACDHHSNGAGMKHFRLTSKNGVKANIPPTWEEFEANLAAVFFQCGVALFEKETTPFELASRHRTDFRYAKRIQKLCQSDVFQAEYDKQTAPKPFEVF